MFRAHSANLCDLKGRVWAVCKHLGKRVCSIRKAQWNSGDQNSIGRLCYQAFYGNMDIDNKITWVGM
jgi:hypothetical protein